MAVLTEKQIKYGFDYYHKDDARPKSVVEVSEYDGEDKLIINCTQLDEDYSRNCGWAHTSQFGNVSKLCDHKSP